MATQKQRRRRAKEKRHEYDLVYVDEDGVEQVIERDEPRKPPAKAGARAGAKTASKSTSGRRGREVKPPSWSKVLKRGAIFAPIFLATVMLLGGGKITVVGAVFQTLLLLVVFVPFSYFMDRVVYRQQQKRLNRGS